MGDQGLGPGAVEVGGCSTDSEQGPPPTSTLGQARPSFPPGAPCSCSGMSPCAAGAQLLAGSEMGRQTSVSV